MSKSRAAIRVFGIRHHGPGSTRRLERALQQWAPDCLLLEAPLDAQTELHKIDQEGFEPPVALVQYDQSDINRLSAFPFTVFSPEWQAIRWCLRTQTELRCMDLPAAHTIALADAKEPSRRSQTSRDPLQVLAELAGYEDVERWWDATFERESDDLKVFESIGELMREMRSAREEESPDSLRREAHMRKCIRKAIRDGKQRLAVVCGAYHVPPLEDVAAFPVQRDQQLLKKLPKVRTRAAWIPWSYEQIAVESGYRAGVLSPAWYELLYQHHDRAAARWMVTVTHLLRSEGFDASPAHAQEGLRLAQALSALRRFSLPGTDELEQAALATIAQGHRERLALIRRQAVIGTNVGKIPATVAGIPLIEDLNRQLRTTRLQKYWENTEEQYLKATKKRARGGLDLRNENDRAKSFLLHRLRLLDIPWGKPEESGPNDLGSFWEIWFLHWQPLFSLLLVERAVYGNSVADATRHYTMARMEEVQELEKLAQRILESLQANLVGLASDLTALLQDRAALSQDTMALLSTFPELLRIIQYGDTRQTDVTGLLLLFEELLPRVAVGLPATASDIQLDVAQSLRDLLLRINGGLQALEISQHTAIWVQLLSDLSESQAVHPLIQGTATRLLFDRDALPLPSTRTRLAYALSAGNDTPFRAHWIEGFLSGSGLILLYHTPLWQLVSGWVNQLDATQFIEVLPMLRRSFADFAPAHRQKMLDLVRKGGSEAPAAVPDESVTRTPIYSEESLVGRLRKWID